MSQDNFQSGAQIDTRSEVEKAKDYKFEETVASVNPVNWTEKTSYRSFPIFNQDGSGSCVAQTMAKLLGILYFIKNNVYVHFSATDIYQRRNNKPGAGMAGVDAFNIVRKGGATLEVLVPSQNMNDEEMDSVAIEQYKHDVGAIFKIDNFLQPAVGDMEAIASVIQTTGKAVMVWFYFTIDEWTTQPTINGSLKLSDSRSLKHSVTAVDYTLVNGKKCLIIEDSWGSSYGRAGQRIIDETFFKARNWFVAYPINFKFAVSVNPTTFFFTIPCQFLDDPALKPSAKSEVHARQSAEVARIQKFLQDKGFFPTNSTCTGYYGAITAGAVLKWQLANNVDTATTLTSLKGWYWGQKSIETANQRP